MFGRAVFRDVAFQVMIWVSFCVVNCGCGWDGRVGGSGGGWEYAGSGSLHLSDSNSSASGRYGNFSVSV